MPNSNKKHNLDPFRLEEYLAKREFTAKYLFCSSDMESRSIQNLLSLAPPEEREVFLNLHLGYTLPEGNETLRAEIAKLYKGLQTENVLCFAGAEEAIYTASRVLLDPKDHAIAITPCYQSLESVAKIICEVSTVSLDLRDGQWHLDLDKIAMAVRPNTRLLFLNFPHNPTGYIPSEKLFRDIIELARQNNLIVFSDEVYRGLELDPKEQLPSASEIYENALSLSVTSKAFGFAGLRIGWVTSRNRELLHELGAYKHYLSICNSAPSEWLATVMLRYKDLILKENQNLLCKNYALLEAYFHQRSDLFEWISPKGGCIAYPRYLGRESIYNIADKLLEQKGVVILPDRIYNENNQHFRVGFGRQNCPEALKHFAEFFEENF